MRFTKIIALVLVIILATQVFALDKAPNFKLENNKGKQVELEDYLGKGFIIVDFWATWCGPCKKELPELCKINRTHDDIQVIAISVDKPRNQKKAKKFVKSRKLSFDLLFDPKGEASKKFNVTNYPTTVVLNAKGEIIFEHSGYQKGDEKKLIKSIEKWKKQNK